MMRNNDGNKGSRQRQEPDFEKNHARKHSSSSQACVWYVSAQDRLLPKEQDLKRACQAGYEEADMAAMRGRSKAEKAPKSQTSKRSAKKHRARRKRSFIGFVFSTFIVLGIWSVIIAAGVIAYHFAQLPPIDKLTVPKRPPNVAVLATDGSLLANRGDMGGRTVSLDELPPYLPKAFVAIEDRRFYEHMGIDPVGITRALLRNLTARGVSQGGSTLTQQLAKNLFLTQDRTMSRKIQEAILSVWLEQNFTKNEILALYLNRVYFGAGAYGVEAAALRYFGKPAKEVTLAEAAMLAGLVQAPSRLSPRRNPTAAQARAQLVLTNMAELGFITDNQAKNALMTPAETIKAVGTGNVNYAADYVMDVLDDFIGSVESDIVVQTTIDRSMMRAAEHALSEVIDKKGASARISQGALVALTNDGQIRALIGGRNYATSQFNRATTARRQPGSAFKPFVYLTALERGLTPGTVREDGPINLNGWQPQNYSRNYRGPVTLATALAFSINTVVVKLAVEVGPRAVVETAQRLGITSPLTANASIALGTSEVSPLELTAAYTAFSNGGIGIIPWIIHNVKTADGRLLYQRQPYDLGQVISEQNASMMNYMLHQAVLLGSARRGYIQGYEVAAKTGTSQESRDAWFVGYTSGLVASVWLGNDNNSPTKNITGGTLPAETWHAFMVEALKGIPPTPLPGSPWDASPRDLPINAILEEPSQSAENPTAGYHPQPVQEKGFFDRLFGG